MSRSVRLGMDFPMDKLRGVEVNWDIHEGKYNWEENGVQYFRIGGLTSYFGDRILLGLLRVEENIEYYHPVTIELIFSIPNRRSDFFGLFRYDRFWCDEAFRDEVMDKVYNTALELRESKSIKEVIAQIKKENREKDDNYDFIEII